MGGYAGDLAHIHDAGFTAFARHSTPGVLAALRRAGIAHGHVVELGCGSGVTARALADAGYRVLGIDQSAAMVRLARRAAPRARFRRASFLHTPLPPCDALLALGEVFNYVFDPALSMPALAGFFRRAHAALRPGGLLLFDSAGPGRGAGPRRSFATGEDWAVLVATAEDRRRRTLTREIVTFRRTGRHWRRSEETHELRLFRPANVLGALRRAGFRASAGTRYGRWPVYPGLTVYRARKPA